MTTWGEIYNQVLPVLLESGSFRLGLITDSEFYTMAAEVLIDFLATTGLYRQIYNVTLHFSISTYNEPETLASLQVASANGIYLEPTSGYFLDYSVPSWFALTNQPETYREDELSNQIQVSPAPNVEGNAVLVDAGQGGYGVISGTLNPNDFNVTTDYTTPAGYGTISGFNGNPYFESSNPGYGVPTQMIPSAGNLQLIGSAIPLRTTALTAATVVEMVPDSFTPYLKYGILQKIFSSDSELKDDQKAAYCAARYSEGVNLLAAAMGEYVNTRSAT